MSSMTNCLLVLALSLSLAVSEDCTAPWTEFSGSCYYMSSTEQETEMTWVDARASCMQQGADLVSVNSIAENDFLKGMLNESSYQGRLWTGLNQRDDREHYRWSDGSGTDFNDWSIDQPVQTGRQQCACLSSRPSQFRRLNGVNTMWGLLQKPSDAKPPRTFKFGFRYDPYRGADWCEQMCDRQIGCFSYTFMNPYMSNITWVAECMGRSNFTDVQVNDPDATSGIRQALPVGTWFSANCGSKMGFVCKKRKGSDAPLTVAPTTPAAGYCPVGYFNVSGNKCFKLVHGLGSNRRDWAGALEICRRGPGYLPDLASISSEIDNAAITARLDGYAIGLWLGLHQSNGLWSWTDNSAVDFTKWAPGEPSINTGDCGEMWTYPGPSGTWNNVLCSKMRGYVCETFKDPAHPVATPPSTTLNRCPDGYTNRHGEACYRLLPEPVTWIEASRQCQSDDAHLVSIHCPSENAAVFLMVGGPLWIGLKQDSGEYKWTDGWPDDYTNWEAEEPGSGDGCIAMNAASKWTDSRCNVRRAAVCKKTTALLPTTPTIAPGVCPRTGRWAEFGGHCYYFSSFYEVPVSWTSAKLTCRQLGAHLYTVSLTSIHSSAEQDFIYNTWKKQYSTSRHSGLWVGLRSQNSEDILRWTDNSALQYSHWAPGEPSRGGGPDGPTKQCMMLHTRSWPGLWHLQQCDRKGGYVCKTEKLLPPTTPTLPPEIPGECPSGADWQSYGTFCYAFKLSYALSWEEAQDECVKHGGPMASLASIRHSSENWFVWQKVQELAGSRPINAAWIGLKKDAHDKPWAWRDGTNVGLLNWAEDEPEDDPEMHCAGMWTNTGEWHSNKCHRSFGYVCKVAKVLYTTAKSSEEPSATTHGHIATSTQTTRGASGLSPSAIVGIVFGTIAGLLCIGAVVFIVVVKLNFLESVKLPTVSFHNPNYERHKDEAVEAKVDGNDSAATTAVVTSDAAVIDVK